MMRSTLKKLLSTVFSVVVYFALSAVVLVHANGLQFEGCSITEMQSCSVQTTSGLYIDGDVADLEHTSFFLNSMALEVTSLPHKILWLEPGDHYTLEVVREGFVPLHKEFKLEKEQVQRIYIMMISDTLSFTKASVFPDPKKEILEVRNKREIFDVSGSHSVFLGRMSQPILDAVELIDGYIALLDNDGKVTLVDWDMQNKVVFPWENVDAIRADAGVLTAKLKGGEILEWKSE